MAKAKRVKNMKKAKTVSKSKAVKIKKMPKAELSKYKKLLLKERERLVGGIAHITENTLKKSLREASGDLSGYSYHMADTASDDYDRDFSLGRATEDQNILYRVDEAMKKIDDGSYGLCSVCGKPIPKKRLGALPYAETCIKCTENK